MNANGTVRVLRVVWELESDRFGTSALGIGDGRTRGSARRGMLAGGTIIHAVDEIKLYIDR